MFAYDRDYCPLTGHRCATQNDPSDQGLCANFVRYSPYGLWTLTVPDPEGQGIDIAAVTALRFEFQITFQPPKDQNNDNLQELTSEVPCEGHPEGTRVCCLK